MATKTVTLIHCDMPHDDDVDAMSVTITTPDGAWNVDVCADHAAHFLMPVITAGRQQKRTRTRSSATPTSVV